MVDDRDREELIAMSRLLMTHDLTCVTGDLIDAAHRHARQGDRSIPRGATVTRARAAVAFTIQLAIEEGRDPVQMRALERELFAELTGKPEGQR